MSATLIAHLRHLGVLWLFGAAALAATTWVCFGLGLGFAVTSFAFLVLIVLLSLLDSLISSLFFSVIAVVCLDYFFVPPLFTLLVYSEQDYLALATFVVASVVITALVRRIRRLAESQREQAGLLNLTRDTILVRDLNDVITYWNRGAEELYGWKSEEAVGQVAHDLLQTIFPAPLEDIMRELLAVGRWEGEFVHTTRDGSKVNVASRWSVQSDGRGRRLGTLETNNDITERKRVEDALNRSRAAYFAEAQKLSSTGSVGWNVTSGEIFWSDESYRIFGYELTVRPTIEMIIQRAHPDDAPIVRQAIDQATRSHGTIDIEHRLLLPDGGIRHVHVVAHPLSEEPEQFVGAIMDVTELRKAEEALRQAYADLARVSRITTIAGLTASLAHEISQPITAAVANANACLRWLADDTPDLGELRGAAAAIVRNGNRAAEIIGRTRQLFEKGAPQREAIEVDDVVRETLILLGGEAARHSVSIRTSLAAGLPGILADRVQLQQVLMNLILNSIEAMREVYGGREIAIEATAGNGEITVSVSDTGMGLPPELADHLFETLFTTKQHGTGMGLSISRSIVDAHGGRLWAEPNELRGAVFRFTLPTASPQATA